MLVLEEPVGRTTQTQLSVNMTSIAYRDSDERPFTAERVIKPGSSTVTAPRVVSCYWSPIKTENLYTPTMTDEEMDKNVGCTKHARCKGHTRMDPTGTVHMIPHGFAIGDELRSSDAYMMNKMVMEGRKDMHDVAKFCFDRISGKRGLLRKACNGTRPTNTFRFVATPSNGPLGVAYLPYHFFDKGQFVYVYANGRCVMKKVEVGQTIMIGRCPAQGKDSTLPVKALRGEKGSSSIRITLEVCPKTNADFDGDEMYGIVPAGAGSQKQLDEEWINTWIKEKVTNICETVSDIITKSGGDPTIDPAMYSTMPLEDMETHPGGKMYELLMLKPKSWRVMVRTMHNSTYWKSWVTRSEQGIVNTIMGRHGIAGPYGYMRLGMMLGTCVMTSMNKVTINSSPKPGLPCVDACPGMNRVTCSSAMTKLTKILYQRGIDVSKHGKLVGLTPAMETLMSMSAECYAIKEINGDMSLSLTKTMNTSSSPNPCTTLEWIYNEGMRTNIIASSTIVTSMIEEVDNVMLTPQERIMVSILFAFLSLNVRSVMERDSIDVIYSLGFDWYTAATCSDVRWLKSVIRDPSTYPGVRLDTDINSTLGAIFLGNMSLMTPENTGEYGDGTVKMNTDTEVIDWASDY